MSEREQQLEAALRKVIDASTEHLMHGTDITIFCNQVLDVVTQQELCEALATPPTSAWNDAITEVIALVASGKGDDQALLRQRIRALKRKEQA